MELTEQEEAYFHKMFELYDTDKSGAIGLSELRNLAKHLGIEIDDAQLLASVKSIGINVVDSEIDLAFPQFVKWLQHSNTGGDEFALLKAKITAQGKKALNNQQIARLKEVFEHFDADGSGSIDADELGTVFASMGQEATKEELEAMIAGVDDDGSGQIEFNEFMVLMCSNFGSRSFEEDMREAFEELDPDRTGKISVDVLRDFMATQSGGLLSEKELDEICTSINSVKGGDVEYMKWESLWEACRDQM